MALCIEKWFMRVLNVQSGNGRTIQKEVMTIRCLVLDVTEKLIFRKQSRRRNIFQTEELSFAVNRMWMHIPAEAWFTFSALWSDQQWVCELGYFERTFDAMLEFVKRGSVGNMPSGGYYTQYMNISNRSSSVRDQQHCHLLDAKLLCSLHCVDRYAKEQANHSWRFHVGR
jgi:hypothetical protein